MKKFAIALFVILLAVPALPCGWFFNPDTQLEEWTCGNPCIFDPNGDAAVDFADVVYLVNYVYYSGPSPVRSGDANGDGVCDSADIIYLLNYLYYDGPPPMPLCS